MRRTAYIALLRAINVGGHNRIAMPELRSLCADLGWDDVQTYIQSGNLIFRAAGARSKLAPTLEQAIRDRFGIVVPVIMRAAEDWSAYIAGNPLAEASVSAPNRVMLALSQEPPHPAAANLLQGRTTGSERVEQVGDALWILYDGGVARTKLSPAVLDRLVGSPVTTRNWRTVLKLGELAEQIER